MCSWINNIMAKVYWVTTAECKDILTDGYVGITVACEKNRLWTHKKKGVVPSNATVTVIFEGTKEECAAKERELRPEPHIGWNTAKGGGGGGMIGRKHSEQTRLKMKQRRSEWHDKHPDWKTPRTDYTASKRPKPLGFSEKLRKIAKSRYRINLPEGGWTWGYRSPKE